jgi:glycerol uptake facilitator protein
MLQLFGEFLGTGLLILLGNGVVAGVLLHKSKAQNSGWLVITLAWGLAVTVAVYASASLSGAHLNPAVSFALAIKGDLAWSLFLPYALAQIAGAMVGSGLVYLHYLPHWKETEDADAKLAIFCTAPAIPHTVSNMISEVIGTFVMVFGILAIGINKMADGFGPFMVGMLVVVVGLALGGTTGYAINPARDLGPRIMHALLPIHGKRDSNWGYAWIPVIAPLIGAALAALAFMAIPFPTK